MLLNLDHRIFLIFTCLIVLVVIDAPIRWSLPLLDVWGSSFLYCSIISAEFPLVQTKIVDFFRIQKPPEEVGKQMAGELTKFYHIKFIILLKPVFDSENIDWNL